MAASEVKSHSYFSSCLKLIRFDKPVGTFLLLWPTWWALWIAYQGHVPLKTLILFTVGVFLMRSAGCIANDIADRNFDPFVERTRTRPLASQEISLTKAIILLFIFLLLALIDVLFLNTFCLLWAFIALPIALIYPLMKRFIAAPQCVLGLAFSLGIPMAFSQSFNDWPWNQTQINSWKTLWAIGILWPIIYDTLYAMVDKKDDTKIGIHSTALLFGRFDRLIISFLETVWIILWLYLAYQLALGIFFYIALIIVSLILIFESFLIKTRHPSNCFQAFKNHAVLGGIMWLGLLFS